MVMKLSARRLARGFQCLNRRTIHHRHIRGQQSGLSGAASAHRLHILRIGRKQSASQYHGVFSGEVPLCRADQLCQPLCPLVKNRRRCVVARLPALKYHMGQ